MQKHDLATITRIMNRTLMHLVEDGAIAARGEIDTVAFFGFRPEDVAGIHTHKIGVGDGVWFRLNDGRVFNRYGGIDEPNPTLYDTTENRR